MDLVFKSFGILAIIAALGNYIAPENFLLLAVFGWAVAEHLNFIGGAPVY